MSLNEAILKREDRIVLELCSLYRQFGYIPYKMSKFEEYDLYARNKDFLMSQEIITFTDTDGHLMALKPDVTLSIVHGAKPDGRSVEKVYYDENVYRTSLNSRTFREIRQIGLECIGAVDDYCIAETLLLAARSLREISEERMLSISHLGVISAALRPLGLGPEAESRALKYIGEKNRHELHLLLREQGAAPEKEEYLTELLSVRGDSETVLPRLEALGCDEEALRQLGMVSALLEKNGEKGHYVIDFSVFTDMNYYNGLVFRGFVRGVPTAVLSGGQYDKLLRKMDKPGSAVGFAACLDQLELLEKRERAYDVDVLLLYDEGTDPLQVSEAVQALTAEGCSVTAQKEVSEKICFRHLRKLTESGVTELV